MPRRLEKRYLLASGSMRTAAWAEKWSAINERQRQALEKFLAEHPELAPEPADEAPAVFHGPSAELGMPA